MSNRFAEKVAGALFSDEQERVAFLEALAKGDARRLVRICNAGREPWADGSTLPDWVPDFVQPAEWESGAEETGSVEGTGYLLDLASVWEVCGLSELRPSPRRVLDLCAAPGGKSVFCRRLWSNAELILNEVVPRRLRTLRANVQRFGAGRAFAQRWTADQWSNRAAAAFDVVLVDAPCSGQALAAKGVRNPGCFHPVTVRGCARRQRRIVKAAGGCVAPGGWLLYTTCAFSREENEKTVESLLSQARGWEAREISKLRDFRSPEATFPCYRLYPQAGFGSGGFCCFVQREGEREPELPELDPEARAFPL